MTTPSFVHPIHGPIQLGKAAPRRDKKTLRLAKYITPALPPPPPTVDYIDKVTGFPMYLNDTLGDCVIAAAGHAIQRWTTYAGKEVDITDADVLKGYEDVGGYVPGDPSTDQGCVMLDALKYWRTTGFAGHVITAFVSVDPKNLTEMKQAIYLFGDLYMGLALPISAQTPMTGANGKPCWNVPPEGPFSDGSPGSWGGHCVDVGGYGSDAKGNFGFMPITWGSLYDMTPGFIYDFSDELYAILSPDFMSKAGTAPNGFNLAQLEKDLAAVTA